MLIYPDGIDSTARLEPFKKLDSESPTGRGVQSTDDAPNRPLKIQRDRSYR